MEQSGHENVERTDAAGTQIFVQRFDPDTYERRKRAARETARDFIRGGGSVAIFFFLRSIAVTVLEIKPEIFNRLTAQFLDNARVYFFTRRDTDGARQRFRVGRIFLERTQRDRAEFLGRVRAK